MKEKVIRRRFMAHFKKIIGLFLLINCLILQGTQVVSYSTEEDLNFKDQNYFIRKDYISRKAYLCCDQTKRKDKFQDEVYAAAFDFASKQSCRIIADVGCGSGFKLLKYFEKFQTIGFEIDPNLSFLKSRYPERQWYLSDFSVRADLPQFDIIICADVVEHLIDPDQLLNWIRKLNFKYLVISTPDRDLKALEQGYPQGLTGPPQNRYHIREWSFAEFKEYVSQHFDVVDHFHTKKEWWGQTIIATKKQ